MTFLTPLRQRVHHHRVDRLRRAHFLGQRCRHGCAPAPAARAHWNRDVLLALGHVGNWEALRRAQRTRLPQNLPRRHVVGVKVPVPVSAEGQAARRDARLDRVLVALRTDGKAALDRAEAGAALAAAGPRKSSGS